MTPTRQEEGEPIKHSEIEISDRLVAFAIKAFVNNCVVISKLLYLLMQLKPRGMIVVRLRSILCMLLSVLVFMKVKTRDSQVGFFHEIPSVNAAFIHLGQEKCISFRLQKE